MLGELAISSFIEQLGIETITALSPDYESASRLREIVNSTMKIQELIEKESSLIKALKSFLDDQAIRIMTIHKSKGLEFHSVIMLAVENETFWGKIKMLNVVHSLWEYLVQNKDY